MELVGGNDNINTLIHCSTRLRLTLKNPDMAKTQEIKSLDGIIGAVNSGGQYQVIIGNDVAYVYNELAKMMDTRQSNEIQEKQKRIIAPKDCLILLPVSLQAFSNLLSQPLLPRACLRHCCYWRP